MSEAGEPSKTATPEAPEVPLEDQRSQETICDGHKEQYFMSGYEAGKRDAQEAGLSGQTTRELLNELRTRAEAISWPAGKRFPGRRGGRRF